jgi:hypothetical protein
MRQANFDAAQIDAGLGNPGQNRICDFGREDVKPFSSAFVQFIPWVIMFAFTGSRGWPGSSMSFCRGTKAFISIQMGNTAWIL